MIDCTKTEQYFAEKQRMVKLQTGEVCEISCEECPYYLGLKPIEDCKKGCKRRECWNHFID